MIKVYLVILGWIQGLKGLKKTLVVQILSILIIILWHDFSHRSWIGFIEAYHQPFTSLSHWTRSMVHGRKPKFCNLVGLCGCRTKLKKIDINLKSEQQKTAHIQKLAINKKIHIFCCICVKRGKNDYFMRWLFSPSFMKMKQNSWTFL